MVLHTTSLGLPSKPRGTVPYPGQNPPPPPSRGLQQPVPWAGGLIVGLLARSLSNRRPLHPYHVGTEHAGFFTDQAGVAYTEHHDLDNLDRVSL